MNATIKTLDIVMGDKTVPLSKSIVNQLEWLNGNLGDEITALGTVSTADSIYTIFATPNGLQRCTGDMSHKNNWGKLPRLILTK
jgi:hypothetical protein